MDDNEALVLSTMRNMKAEIEAAYDQLSELEYSDDGCSEYWECDIWDIFRPLMHQLLDQIALVRGRLNDSEDT